MKVDHLIPDPRHDNRHAQSHFLNWLLNYATNSLTKKRKKKNWSINISNTLHAVPQVMKTMQHRADANRKVSTSLQPNCNITPDAKLHDLVDRHPRYRSKTRQLKNGKHRFGARVTLCSWCTKWSPYLDEVPSLLPTSYTPKSLDPSTKSTTVNQASAVGRRCSNATISAHIRTLSFAVSSEICLFE